MNADKDENKQADWTKKEKSERELVGGGGGGMTER